MALIIRLFASLLPLALATVAIAFAIKATIAKDWASRNQYNSSLNNEDWTLPDFVEYRSPFALCGFRQDNLSLALTDPDATFSYGCETYSAYGAGKTSCEPQSITRVVTDARYGDMRRCQQTHWAGNLAIASSTFIGIGFLLTFTTSIIAILAIILPAALDEDVPGHSGHVEPETSVTPSKVEPAHHHNHEKRHGSHRNRPHERYLSPAAPYLNVILIFSFSFGAVLFVLAQFYGVLAFVQSAPDNGAFASYGPNGASITVGNGTYIHAPWIQGRAISVYASVAWVSAGLAALSASIVWRMPTLAKKSPL